MRQPFKKNVNEVETEAAHGGSGNRKLLLSASDPISSQLEAMTKGFLAPGGVFDWHSHPDVDEFFVVLAGCGKIGFQSGEIYDLNVDDLIYIPAGSEHRIEAAADTAMEFYFVRVAW